MRRLVSLMVLPVLLVAACGSEGDDAYDPATLAQYKTAIPSKATLTAPALANRSYRAVGDPATFPHDFVPMATAINGACGQIVDLMQAIVALPPTYYNATTKEFVWGPWPSDDDYGTVAAYIKEQPAGSDFKYVYALLRGTSNDLATMKPVIWGGATPGATEDDGVGVTLWDFEANHAFAQANDPDYASKTFDRGRFVALYMAGPDETKPENHVTVVVAVFRDFVPKDKAGQAAVDLDYLYGRVNLADGNRIDFADFATGIDVAPDGGDGVAEAVSVAMAMVNGGVGRAEAAATGGTLTAAQRADVVECWDASIDRTYVNMTFTDGGSSQTYTEPASGTAALCGPIFSQSLDALNVPTLADVPAGMLSAMENVAENGVPAE